MRPVVGSRLEKSILLGVALIAALAVTAPASAGPVSVAFSDQPNCDTLSVPSKVYELGKGPVQAGPFPADEEIPLKFYAADRARRHAHAALPFRIKRALKVLLGRE